jgi:hypothetical protein
VHFYVPARAPEIILLLLGLLSRVVLIRVPDINCLFILVPRVFLVDEDRREIREKHYKPGSTIELHCIVTDYLPHFKEVLWRHGNEVISQASERGGIR